MADIVKLYRVLPYSWLCKVLVREIPGNALKLLKAVVRDAITPGQCG